MSGRKAQHRGVGKGLFTMLFYEKRNERGKESREKEGERRKERDGEKERNF